MTPSSSRPLSIPLGYEALRQSVAWADLGCRSTIFAQGTDAVRFIDNFTTAAVSKLITGQGTEGFFTDARGWVIALSNILRTEEGLWIDASPGLATRLHEHLERHHIREKLELIDASAQRVSILVAGPQAVDWIASRCSAPPPRELLNHLRCTIGGVSLDLVHVDWTGPNGFLLQLAAADRERLMEWLAAEGMVEAEAATIETLRIEAGRPEPSDIPDKTLPQEINRDQRAISFTKGCYLGQETVARIDALGHVNRRLVAVAIEAELSTVQPGAEVRADGELIGRITSCCASPRLGCWLGLGLLQTKTLDTTGQQKTFLVAGSPARVVAVPLAVPSQPEVLLETKRFRVVRVSEVCSDGKNQQREVVEHPGSVVIVPLVSAQEICLVEVFRVAVGKTLLELPAGTLDRVESLEDAARRELAEETGFRAGRMTAVGEFWMSPGILRERMHLFLAKDLTPGPLALEPGEQIRPRVVGFDEAIAMCLDGRIEDAKTITGLLLLAMRNQRGVPDGDRTETEPRR